MSDSEAPISPDSREDEQKDGKGQHQGLTAASFSDALNLDSFLDYLQSALTPKIKIPAESPFQYTMDKTALQTLIPAKSVQAVTDLEIALVLDATGSMGDELDYLKKERKGIISDLQIVFPAINVKTSFVVYRDVDNPSSALNKTSPPT